MTTAFHACNGTHAWVLSPPDSAGRRTERCCRCGVGRVSTPPQLSFTALRQQLRALIESVALEYEQRDAAGHDDGFLSAHARELRELDALLDRFGAQVRGGLGS